MEQEYKKKDNRNQLQGRLQKEMDKMNSFGERTTGSTGHRAFVQWLENEIEAMGLIVHKKEYTFPHWELEYASLAMEEKELEISSVYPYSGETSNEGIISDMVLVTKNNYKKAAGKIALLEIDNKKTIPMSLIMDVKGALPKEEKLVKTDGDVVISSTLWTPDLKKLKQAGILGVVFIWKGISKEKAKNQYAPFTSDYANLPAVWVDETIGTELIVAAKQGKKLNMILSAKKEEVKTESFYVEIKGIEDKETILVNSHTDGVNAIEENGPIAMLSMIRHFSSNQPKKNLLFVFVTGHFRLPIFKGTSQATSKWLSEHTFLWDGRLNHKKVVSALTVEHLGAMEWKDTENGYRSTGKIQTEYVYTNHDELKNIWEKAIQDRSVNRTVFLRGHNKFQFGESQPLFEAKIPVIGFIPMPDYLLTNSANREMDKFNVALMQEQIDAFLVVLQKLDELPQDYFKRVYGYSYGLGKK